MSICLFLSPVLSTGNPTLHIVYHVLSDENPILRIHPSSVSACHSLSLCGACMRVFVTMIMTGQGVEVSKAHAGDEQHPNVVFGGPRPARRWCIFVRACVRERKQTRDESSDSDRGMQSVCSCVSWGVSA